MKIVQINATATMGGTGRVCSGLSNILTEKGIENYILFASNDMQSKTNISYGSSFQIKLQALKSKLFGKYGFNSKGITKKLINELDRIKPDIVHLHNLHGHNVNLEMLVNYFKKNPQIKLFWTFHDCWTFTGYCTYYELAQCEKWKTKCEGCPQRKAYSWFFDRSAELQEKKKELLSSLDFVITTPSKWLSSVIEQSFFKDRDIRVINNGVDLETFKPTESDFISKHGLQEKKIVLGVSSSWEARKGLDEFIELSKQLPKEYQIVLVGTNSKIDKKLPDNIISIHRTENKKELSEIYTSANVFVNPTKEEVFGMVNLEALACGTPVITYNTGGSPECIDESCGIVVPKNDISELYKAIIRICDEKPFSKESCIERAKKFDEKIKHKEYIDLYSM